MKDLTVDTHVGDEEDRSAVGRPSRAIDVIGKVGQQEPRRAAFRRDDEQRTRVVRLELLIRLSEKENVAAVGRKLRLRFLDVVARDLQRLSAVGVDRPHLRIRDVERERRSHALERDPAAIARHTERDDREVAVGQTLLRACRHRDTPEVTLFVVLVERIHIVARLKTCAFFRRPWIGGEEIDERAVRRPDRGRDVGRVTGELARVAAGGRHQKNLSFAEEQDLATVG